MSERKSKGWSTPQAIAISYSQIKKYYPKCRSVLNRRKSTKKKSTKRKSKVRRKSIRGSGNIFPKLKPKKLIDENRIPESAGPLLNIPKKGKRETDKDYEKRVFEVLSKTYEKYEK